MAEAALPAVALDDAIHRGPTRTPAFDALPADVADVLMRCVQADVQQPATPGTAQSSFVASPPKFPKCRGSTVSSQR